MSKLNWIFSKKYESLKIAIVALPVYILLLPALTSCTHCKRQYLHSGTVWKDDSETVLFRAGKDKEYWYPRLIQLRTGELLCACDAKIGEQSNRVLVTKSTDGGHSWEYLSTASFGKGDAANGHMLQLENGELLLAYRLVDETNKTIKISKSNDKGKTWKHHSTVADNTKGLWEPFLFKSSSNEILIFYANEEYNDDNPAYPQVIEMRKSSNQGLTWSPPRIVSKSEHSRDGMPAVAELRDGSIILVIEANYPPHPLVLMQLKSMDNGRTWGDRKLLYKPAERGKRAAAPYVIQTETGPILVSFQTDEDKKQTGELVCEMKVIQSNDSGKSWGLHSKPFCINNGFALWNSLIELEDETIIAASSVNPRKKGSSIKIIRGMVVPEKQMENAIK